LVVKGELAAEEFRDRSQIKKRKQTMPKRQRVENKVKVEDEVEDEVEPRQVAVPPVVKKRSATVYSIADFSFDNHVAFKKLDNPKFRMIGIKLKENNGRVLVQLSSEEGCRIPMSFGVQTNNHGTTNLTVDLPDECDDFKRLQEEILAIAIQNRREWWGKEDISDQSVKENFYSIYTAPKAKKDGNGFWSPSMKMSIPTDKKSGECTARIRDENKNILTVNHLPGASWTKIILEFGCVYFNGKFGCGVSRKLKLIEIKDSHDDEEIDFI
jgi:hypothetical protein